MSILRKILAALPIIEVGMDDWHLHASVGERRIGFTVGPRFLSFDKDNDIHRQIVSPPKGYQAPMSDISFDLNSREGLTYLYVPGLIKYKPRPFAWERGAVSPLAVIGGWEEEAAPTTDPEPFSNPDWEEEPEPPTLRYTRACA